MDWASLLYLGITVGLLIVFALIVVRTCSRKRKNKLEEPKHRMLDDE
ncbi:CcoQ/FixQ family Cbb3-type cytochrome c oxidase assembly chaperone [Desulfuromonas sp. TF]|jgi:hypothetical protein|nr:CcoQ/FixQ family Cbb3-type cytochrome c oxidase assembly chaperone [Desulfuromonas sp. TF]